MCNVGFMHTCDSVEYRITSTKLTSGYVIIMATAKNQKSKKILYKKYMATVNVTDENFESEVIKAGKPVIVDFWAEWCGPCKQIGPILEEISDEMSEVVIAKHNIDNEPHTPTK